MIDHQSNELIDILKEPVGPIYEELIAFASEECASFSLVWRNERIPPATAAITKELEPLLLREEYSSQWPGTELIGHKALVRYYRLKWPAREILAQVPSLFKWLEPNYPEDLAFYTSQGNVWLGSIAHERDAFFGAGGPTIERIRARIPGLRVK